MTGQKNLVALALANQRHGKIAETGEGAGIRQVHVLQNLNYLPGHGTRCFKLLGEKMRPKSFEVFL